MHRLPGEVASEFFDFVNVGDELTTTEIASQTEFEHSTVYRRLLTATKHGFFEKRKIGGAWLWKRMRKTSKTWVSTNSEDAVLNVIFPGEMLSTAEVTKRTGLPRVSAYNGLVDAFGSGKVNRKTHPENPARLLWFLQ